MSNNNTSLLVTPEQLATFDHDGALCLRGVVDQQTCKKMEAACRRLADDPSQHIAGRWSEVPDPPRGYERMGMALSLEDFRSFAFDTALPDIARQLMRTDTVRYFYDQMFIKLHGGSDTFDGASTAEMATPWHQDLPYWPLDGTDILSIWVPFRPVPRNASGLEYLSGSHRDPLLYAPFGLTARRETAELPDFEALREKEPERFLSWDMEPGDCLIHHPRTLHHSTRNEGTSDRIAVSVRYLGRDVAYTPGALDHLWYP